MSTELQSSPLLTSLAQRHCREIIVVELASWRLVLYKQPPDGMVCRSKARDEEPSPMIK